MDDFKKEVTDNKDSFKKSAPFSVEKSQEFDNAKAMEKLQDFKLACVELRQKEEDMKPGLEIFGYEAQHYGDLVLVEKENQLLTEVWELKDQFDEEWFSWKDQFFYDLNIDDIEQRVIDFYNKLMGMTKDIRVWPIFDFLKQKFLLFRDVLPLAL